MFFGAKLSTCWLVSTGGVSGCVFFVANSVVERIERGDVFLSERDDRGLLALLVIDCILRGVGMGILFTRSVPSVIFVALVALVARGASSVGSSLGVPCRVAVRPLRILTDVVLFSGIEVGRSG